jgi:UDP-N-acetylmuramoylalanine--D-glutamate ligase
VAETDIVVVSPGVPESTGPIPWALAAGLPIISEIELGFYFCPAPVVAVTGTNGKSSVVTLIAELLRAARRPAVACGNLGVPFCSVVEQLTPETVAVVEVSSFQLLWCHQFRPKIAVLLNLGTNHLDRHEDSEDYAAAKARIFQQQTPEDWAVVNGRDPRVAALGQLLLARRVWFADNRTNSPAFKVSPETQELLAESAQAVLQVGRIFGIPDPLTWQVIRAFRGLEHRLEPVMTLRGVRFINDSKSTTPDSLRHAVSHTAGPLVLILGGRDKGMDFGPLVDTLRDARILGVVLIGEARARLQALLAEVCPVHEAATLEAATRQAASLATPGVAVLLSPACASFDMFRDFEERGKAFKAIVEALAGEG